MKKEKLCICIMAPTMPPITGGAETFAEVLTLTLVKKWNDCAPSYCRKS